MQKFRFLLLVITRRYLEKFTRTLQQKASLIASDMNFGDKIYISRDGYVLELANKSKAVKWVAIYCKMADIIGMNYVYQECEMGEDTKSKTSDLHEGNIHDDPAELKRNLKLMIK